ncbi:acyltransferase [Selenomonas caprae]|uniref:acyltransferase n=1 Tax=Selenomonas caprae TaxID=2606905 RepID=UPI00165630CB|nr:acyltransferase family protein [Selenomonas caprae]
MSKFHRQTDRQTDRQNNYDLLRIIAALAVICNHTTDYYICHPQENDLWFSCVVWSLVSVAVPIFFMLSGAFLISNDKNADCRYFYKHSLGKLGIPLLVFTIFYISWYVGISLVKMALGKEGIVGIVSVAKYIVTGWHGHPLWFMYTLLGIYCFIPLLVRIRKYTTVNCFRKYGAIFSLWCVISFLDINIGTSWNIGLVACYMGYVVSGYILYDLLLSKKNNFVAAICLICALLIGAGNGMMLYEYVLATGELRNVWVSSAGAPLMVIEAVLVFVGFAFIRIKINLFRLSVLTFPVYLIHKFVLEVLQKAKCEIWQWNSFWGILISVFCTFILSLLLAWMYLKIYSVLRK